MEVHDWASSSGGSSDSEVCVNDVNDEDTYLTSDMPKLQFRKNVSKGRWCDEVAMTEVLEKKGSMWTTTGISRNGKTYCSIEETLFLAERGELSLTDADDSSSFGLEDLYKKVAEEKSGCCWESFEVYRCLRSLGYIVGRHGIPWSMKSVKNMPAFGEGILETSVLPDPTVKEPVLINELFSNMRVAEARAVFDVYPPNSKFRKSSPGNPSFVVCLTSGNPPPKPEIEELESKCDGVPLKFCHVDHGRVSFISFNKVDLPVLP